MNQPRFATLEDMIVATAEAVRPPERLTVSQAAEKYRWLNNPGHYVGPWDNDKAPYLVEPMDELTSLDFTGEVFVGPARTGKALALDTPIPTPVGWTTMGWLAVGDHVLSDSGQPTRIIAATEVMLNHKCFRLTFDDGTEIVADAGHQWRVFDHHLEIECVAYTDTIYHTNGITASRYSIAGLRGVHWITNVEPVESVPVRCIQVDSPNSLFLAGSGMIPTHNSDMFFNWLSYTSICDPADMMSVDMTQNTARDWSKGDLRKMLRHSKEVGARIKPGRQNQNVHDIDFMSGMRLLVKWPVISELSGKTIPRLWIRDYDRMTQNVDGEGNPFDLTRKRAQTFGRYGMCVAEASPGFPVINAKWSPSHPHEAPPCDGILSIYNRGDRRRWYWRCLQCDHPFEAKFKDFHWPDSADFMESAEQVSLPCPSCGYPHTQEMKHDLNLGGKWIKQGQTWLPDGSVDGDPKRSDIASFWLMGPAAAFASWESIVFKFLQATDDYERTGSEESLKTTINVDQGLPYTYKAIEAGRTSDELKERAEDWGGTADHPVVPEDGRFVVKTVDVQARSFVVQTHAVFANGDVAIIETKKLRRSILTDANGEWQAIDPAARPEDWDVLIDELKQTYPLADGSGRRMRIKIMGCDSGGKDGVTANAYDFWRRLRTEGGDLHSRFHLIKGTGSKTAPRLSVTYPDSGRKDRFARARGEVPVQIVNTNEVKDQVSSMLGRDFPGGMVRFPIWAEDWLFNQLTAEIRTPKGWENLTRKRNEAWDLLVYAVALLLHPAIRFGFIDWSSPPGFAEEWDENDLVIPADGVVDTRAAEDAISLAELAEKLG